MITFIKIPNDISLLALLEETQSYIDESGVKGVTAEQLIEADMHIPNIDYYHVYKDNKKIGFVVGFGIDGYWFAHRVWLSGNNKVYFRKLIDALNNLRTVENYDGIIAHPDTKTASLYKKHNIMKEI